MKEDGNLTEMGWKIENSYTSLPSQLYRKQRPTPVRNPEIVIFNDDLAIKLGLNADLLNSKEGANFLSGNKLPTGSIPLAQGYAGHQFGHFTILGDGRAILIGEQISPTLERYDIQLKGSGRTPYSRGGDGRATLSSMLREYIISEAMAALDIPTTRSLAIVSTGDVVIREKMHTGSILTRISRGHIRVGTFQFAITEGLDVLKELADYVIRRFYPECLNEENIYLSLLENVIKRQAELISKWQSVGFIHGVMNTDNVSIVGETIDYGPCAFMDTYNRKTVFSSIDHYGRYAYENQPIITQWNLARFAETLLPLLHKDQNKAIQIAEEAISKFTEIYDSYWLKVMKAKIGIFDKNNNDKNLIVKLLDIMETHRMDFTNTFVSLMNPDFSSDIDSFKVWMTKWHERLETQNETWFDSLEMMRKTNPAIIPRNHQVEEVLKLAVDENNLTPLKEFITSHSIPFAHTLEQKKYSLPPEASDTEYKTYCGT